MSAEPERAPADPSAHDWDVIVIGAGPAGAVAAMCAARAGRSVLLLDKARFPRDKVCGCCLSAGALDHLARLGLFDHVRALRAQPIESLRLVTGSHHVTFSLPHGLAVARGDLDAALVSAAVDAGAEFHDAIHAENSALEGDYRRVTLRSPHATWGVRARMVIAAGGLGSDMQWLPGLAGPVVSPRSYIGLAANLTGDTPYRAGEILMTVGRGGYVGMVRLGADLTHMAAAVSPGAIRKLGGPGALVASIAGASGFAHTDLLESVRWTGTGRLTRRPRRVSAPRLLVIGDAAGYVEPFTGEGMRWAIASGAAAGEIVTSSEPGVAETRWEAWHRREIRPQHRRCVRVSLVLRRPGLTRSASWVLGALPALRRPITRRICAPRALA